MSENILSKFNPLEDDFWGNDSEKKFRQIVNLGYASILASFIAGLMFFFKVGDFSGIIWDFLPFSYYSIWWYYRPPFYFSVFGIPIFNGLFLIYAFSNNKLTTFHKVFSCIFILSFLTDIPAYLFFMEFFDSLVFIGVLSEISYRVIIVILTVFVFFGKPSDLLPSMVKLLVLFSFISFLFSIIGGWLLFSESLEFSRLLGLLAVLFFSYSLLSICHYRININQWDEAGDVSLASSSVPEQQPSSLSSESIAKLKSLSELRDSGVLSDDEFKEQKAKIMSETDSFSTYIGNGAPIDDTFRILMYIISFIIPLVGIVVGIFYNMRPDNDSQEFGKMCLKIGVASIFIGFILGILFTLIMFSAY